MNLDGKTLEEWFLEQAMTKMPWSGKMDYVSAYKSLADYLNNNVHTKVNVATILSEIEQGKRPGYLTDHGPDHIKTVIKRVSNLLEAERLTLTLYEAYLLLLAIHFHDIGHIKQGREQHEKNSKDILKQVGLYIGNDTAEQRLIWKIAEAHGGSPKDKISLLSEKENILGFTVRTQLLAALLKFGDELADDRTRADRYLLGQNKVPGKSAVYHEYANALYSVQIDIEGKEIILGYEIILSKTKIQYEREDGKTYLVDEIISRLKKMHTERMYCMRFFAPYFQIDTISAKIEFYDEDGFERIGDPLGIKFKEDGYPDISGQAVEQYCTGLKNDDFWGDVSGENVKKKIEETQSTQASSEVAVEKIENE